MNKFFKKRTCGMCGNTVEEENGLSFLHSRINGDTVSYRDDTTCSGSGKETHLRVVKWIYITVSIIGSALIVGMKYNHNKARTLKTN